MNPPIELRILTKAITCHSEETQAQGIRHKSAFPNCKDGRHPSTAAAVTAQLFLPLNSKHTSPTTVNTMSLNLSLGIISVRYPCLIQGRLHGAF